MKFDKQYTLAELARLLALRVVVNSGATAESIKITGVATIEVATPGDITFIINDSYVKYLPNTKATAIILPSDFSEACNLPALYADNSRLALIRMLELAMPSRADARFDVECSGVSSSAVIGMDCVLADDISIGPNCVIGDRVVVESGVVIAANTVVGNDCFLRRNSTLRANVTLYPRVEVGEGSTVHSATVVGSDGFGYANDAGSWVKMPHVGGVKIGNNVEIGSNVSIDRGFLDDTIIADGVIIDNLVQIGHNVKIGENTAVAGCTAIAGSAVIGKNCLLGGASRIVGHIVIEDGTVITAASNVNRSLKKGIYSSAFPAKENAKWRRNVARFNFLDEMAKRLHRLEGNK